MKLHGTRIWPQRSIPAGEHAQIEVVVRRPGLISWLRGSTQRVRLRLTAPTTSLRSHYLALPDGSPLRLRFTRPVTTIAYGQPGAMHRQVLPAPETVVDLSRTAEGGSELVAAASRSWESAPATTVSWFPASARSTSAVATPATDSRIGLHTPITLTFSEPITQALRGHLSLVSPSRCRCRRAST